MRADERTVGQNGILLYALRALFSYGRRAIMLLSAFITPVFLSPFV